MLIPIRVCVADKIYDEGFWPGQDIFGRVQKTGEEPKRQLIMGQSSPDWLKFTKTLVGLALSNKLKIIV